MLLSTIYFFNCEVWYTQCSGGNIGIPMKLNPITVAIYRTLLSVTNEQSKLKTFTLLFMYLSCLLPPSIGEHYKSTREY